MCRGNIFLISLPDKTENSLWNSSQLILNCDFNLYLVILGWDTSWKPLDGFKVISAFHLSNFDLMSTRNFWQKVNCLLVVALSSLEPVAPHPQKRAIKFYVYLVLANSIVSACYFMFAEYNYINVEREQER